MTLSLPDAPHLEHLKTQAKSLLKAFLAGDAEALRRVREFHPRPAQTSALKLSDAQLVVAREYGFASWPKLKQHVLTPTPEQTK